MRYFYDFLRQKPDMANAVAAVASALTAVFALIVSVVALCLARATLKHQRRHNILSVKPLPNVAVGDYENRLIVSLKNQGSGPMIVRGVKAIRGQDVRSALIEWMPSLPAGMAWTTFVASIADRAVLPGDAITLLELNGDSDDPDFGAARDKVRRALSSVNMVVEFTDMYDSPMATVSRDLGWFGRNLGYMRDLEPSALPKSDTSTALPTPAPRNPRPNQR